MSISSRFSVGIHLLTLIEINKNGDTSSTFLAGSVNTNPVVVRKIMGMLKKAGLIQVHPGIAGATISRDLSAITLLDVYQAVHVVKDNELFNIHENPNPECPVGRNIQGAIEPLFSKAQHALENVLKNVTIQDVVDDVAEKEKQE